MCDLSLTILDLVMNAVQANAEHVCISISADQQKDWLSIIIADDGTGLEDTGMAVDPFFTQSTQKQVGLGLPLFRYAALRTGGSFHLSSAPGRGATVEGKFLLSSLERPPLGDLAQTISVLCAGNGIRYELTLDNSIKRETLCFTGGRIEKADSVLKRTEELTLKMFGGILSEISF